MTGKLTCVTRRENGGIAYERDRCSLFCTKRDVDSEDVKLGVEMLEQVRGGPPWCRNPRYLHAFDAR